MTVDVIFNGQSSGDVGDRLLENNMDSGALRPYQGADGRCYITLNQRGPDGKPIVRLVANANSTLLKDEWKEIDKVAKEAAKPRLRFVQDLVTRGLVHTVGNGMGKTMLEEQRSSDVNDASISMDGLAEGERDRQEHDSVSIPLPIIHKDFSFTLREIQASRNGTSPLDTKGIAAAGQKVGEMVEKLALGVAPAYKYGGGYVYGALNYPSALTKTITAPTASGWTGTTLLDEVLAMKSQSQAAHYYGPWMVYCSPSWDRYMDADFKSQSDITLRERLSKIDGIGGIKTLDYMTDYDIVMIQMTSDVIRMVDGLKMSVVQWDSNGGMKKNFKVMTILVPQPGCDFNSNTGIVYASAP